jgi:hypothetical protein
MFTYVLEALIAVSPKRWRHCASEYTVLLIESREVQIQLNSFANYPQVVS